MEGDENKLPEHVKRSIDRHEAAADKIKKESAALLGSKGDPLRIAETRNVLARKRFNRQRIAEHIRSEFGLPPEDKIARRQIEERKTEP